MPSLSPRRGPSAGLGSGAALTALLDEAEHAEAIRASAINDLNAELATADQASSELRGEDEELYDNSRNPSGSYASCGNNFRE